jgi:hypothetical protein
MAYTKLDGEKGKAVRRTALSRRCFCTASSMESFEVPVSVPLKHGHPLPANF